MEPDYWGFSPIGYITLRAVQKSLRMLVQGDMHMVAATLGCEGPWLGLGGPPPTLTVWVGLENTTLTL